MSYPDLLPKRAWLEVMGSYHLTNHELTVLQLLCRGLANEAIAQSLGVSQSTVRTHLKAIYAKLNCHNRVELILTLVHGRKKK